MTGTVKQYPLSEEYKKDHKSNPEDIKKLREWVLTQPHLPAQYISDLDLILIYHCCDQSAEVAKQVLDLNLTLRTLFTTFFKDRVVDDNLLNKLNYYCLVCLETRAHDRSTIFYGRLLNNDPKIYVLADVFKLCFMTLDLWQYEEGTWPGLTIIIDLDRLTLSHLAKLDLQSMQQFLYYLQEAMLVKIKTIHYLNAPPFMDKLMMLIRPFLKKELYEKFNIHQTNSKTIWDFVPISALPKEAGGEYKSCTDIRDELVKKFTANADFFLDEANKRVIESKRPGKPKTISDIFGGVVGSFKKLNID